MLFYLWKSSIFESVKRLNEEGDCSGQFKELHTMLVYHVMELLKDPKSQINRISLKAHRGLAIKHCTNVCESLHILTLHFIEETTTAKLCVMIMNDDFSGFNLAEKLSKYNLEEHLEEIVENIWGERYEKAFQAGGVKDWNSNDVTAWVLSLRFLGEDCQLIARKLEEECIDGGTLTSIRGYMWTDRLKLSFHSYYMMELIFRGWALGSRTFKLDSARSKPIGVMAGVVADLSACSPELARRLTDADNACVATGAGYIYGQLVVLGYKEYRLLDNALYPFGASNEKFLLKRRRIPNGIQRAETRMCSENDVTAATAVKGVHKIVFHPANEQIVGDSLAAPSSSDSIDSSVTVIDFVSDPTRDAYQIGRMTHSTNDFHVSGQLHEDEEGVPTGPVSRYACRIECERLAPFRTFIFSGAFDNHNEIKVAKWMRLGETVAGAERPGPKEVIDGFTTFGVKVWHPDTARWVEISVLGHAYEPRAECAHMPGARIPLSGGGDVQPPLNMLRNGSIVDIGGVAMVFQGPVSMARTMDMNPSEVIQSLNEMKPQCPVLFNEIKFSFLDSKQRAVKAIRRSTDECLPAIMPFGSFHIPATDYSDVSAENRSYVFPACGHVHGYHRSMENKPCPFCRKSGPFVPIAFSFEPSICDRRPTHVFNPCGHVASHRTCHFWSQMPLYSRNLPSYEMGPMCPFCATALAKNDSSGGGGCAGYSRLVLQTESGASWPADCTLEEDQARLDHLQNRSQVGEDIVESQKLLFSREQTQRQIELAEEADTAINGSYSTFPTLELKFPKYTPQLQ